MCSIGSPTAMASRQNKKTMIASIASKDLHAQKNESNKIMARRITTPIAMEEKTSILSTAPGYRPGASNSVNWPPHWKPCLESVVDSKISATIHASTLR